MNQEFLEELAIMCAAPAEARQPCGLQEAQTRASGIQTHLPWHPKGTLLILHSVRTSLEVDSCWLHLEAFWFYRDFAIPRLEPSRPAPGPAE